MLNYLWAGMIMTGIIYAVFTGNMEAVTNGALDSAKEAITLCITMCGVMGLWTGLMEVAKKSGLIDKMTKGIAPFVTFLFPNIPKDNPAREYISINMISNVLGLGWAATPAGLKAMEYLMNLEEEREKVSKRQNSAIRTKGTVTGRIASDEMCTFLIVNISSLQLIPVNIIAYRSQYGSVNPTAVIGPGLIATTIGTLVAIIYCKIRCKINSHT